MENFNIQGIPEFDDINLQTLINSLKKCYADNQSNFAKVAFLIWKISNDFGSYVIANDKKYYRASELLEMLGFDKAQVSRYKQSYTEFVQGSSIENVTLKEMYFGFSPSKLFELLKLSFRTRENAISKGIIRPDMTVKDIRDYVKFLENKNTKKETIADEDLESDDDCIEMAYDPKTNYKFEYFKSKSKNQLINIVWELQKEYQKLLNKKK